MSSLKKINKEFEIIELEDENTYVITKNTEKIIIHDMKLIENYIDKKFNEKYRKLLYIIMDIANNEDATDSDAEIIRNQIEELRAFLINKFGKYISRELLNKYLKMLILLEEKIVLPERSKGR